MAHDVSGVNAIEYDRIAGAIAVIVVATVLILGPQLNSIFTTAHTSMSIIPGGR